MITRKVGETERGTGYVDSEQPQPFWGSQSYFPHRGYVVTPDGAEIHICKVRSQLVAEYKVQDYLGLIELGGPDVAA